MGEIPPLPRFTAHPKKKDYVRKKKEEEGKGAGSPCYKNPFRNCHSARIASVVAERERENDACSSRLGKRSTPSPLHVVRVPTMFASIGSQKQTRSSELLLSW
jgi:hypothetical protein